MRPSHIYLVSLCLIWIVSAVIVNPSGEFMVNDDYAFVSSLEKLMTEGKLGSTGKGPAHASGGPSLVTHLAWGWAFTKVFGYSLTSLRLSICFLGLMGVIGLFLILRSIQAPDWLSFLASLTLMFNPLYFSQSFTFMTDITFVTLIIFSVYFLNLGIERESTALVITGLILSLAGMLTRQLALVIPVAFAIAVLITAGGKKFGRIRCLSLTFIFVIIPWLGFEWFLSFIGSSPITKHEKLHDLFSYPFLKGFPDYPLFVLGQFSQSVLGYTAFLISPVIALRLREFSGSKPFTIFLITITGLSVVLEVGIATGLIAPPILLSRNVIYNFGIGPVLLKDSYILGINRTWTMSPMVFYFIVWWTILCLGIVLIKLFEFGSILLGSLRSRSFPDVRFLSVLTILATGGYSFLVILTDLHDRYVIPISALMLIWICSSDLRSRQYVYSWKFRALASIPLVFMMVFSVLGTRDFMEIRRTVSKANYFLVSHLKVKPCDFDGGFEFNGYHCYDTEHRVGSGQSWWWVKNEKYIVTLGSLADHETVAEFPFERMLGPNGKVHILKPARN